MAVCCRELAKSVHILSKERRKRSSWCPQLGVGFIVRYLWNVSYITNIPSGGIHHLSCWAPANSELDLYLENRTTENSCVNLACLNLPHQILQIHHYDKCLVLQIHSLWYFTFKFSSNSTIVWSDSRAGTFIFIFWKTWLILTQCKTICSYWVTYSKARFYVFMTL